MTPPRLARRLQHPGPGGMTIMTKPETKPTDKKQALDRLALKRQTLRQLDDRQLAQVAGGRTMRKTAFR
jgi:hypothetical protein